jgi:hypothetical protein
VAFVKDEHDKLAAQLLQPFGIVYAVCSVQCDAQLLDGRNDDFVGVVFGKHPIHQHTGADIFLNAVWLEPVELIARLGIQVFAINDEEHFLDGRIVLEQGGRLEAGQRLTAPCGVPNVPVPAVLVDAADDVADGIDLVRPHHENLLLGLHKDHVATDHLAQVALGEKLLSKVVKVRDLCIVLSGPFVNREESLLSIEGEVAIIVVGEVVRVGLIADDEDLQKTQQGIRVAVARIGLVSDDLHQCLSRIDRELLQFDLHHGYTVQEQNDVVAVEAIGRVHAQLVDDLEGVLTPVAGVNELEMQGCVVFAHKCVTFAQAAGGEKDIRSNDLLEEPVELFIRQLATIE